MNKFHFAIAASTAALVISTAGVAGAQTTSAPAASAASAEMAEGEVRKVDKENQKLTIKHGPLKNLDMPGSKSRTRQCSTRFKRVTRSALLLRSWTGNLLSPRWTQVADTSRRRSAS